MQTKSSLLSLLALAFAVNAQYGPAQSGSSLRIRDLEDRLYEALQTRDILLAREAEAEAEAAEQEIMARFANPWAYAYPEAEAEAYDDEAYNGYALNVRGVGDPAPPDANGQPYCLKPSGSLCLEVNPKYKSPSGGAGGASGAGGVGGAGGSGGLTRGSMLMGGAQPRIGTTMQGTGGMGGTSSGGMGGAGRGPTPPTPPGGFAM